MDDTLLELILPWNRWVNDIEGKLKEADEKILKDYQSRKISLPILHNSYVRKDPQLKTLLIENAIKFETENLKEIRINHELVDFAKSLKGYKLFIWTGNTRKTAQKVLKKVGIFKKFQKIITCEDVILVKPEPDGFNAIWDGKTPKGNFLFICNSQEDKQAAKRAGIDFYQIDYFK